jgi:RNA polymerase sigma factor (sigma-70 family)
MAGSSISDVVRHLRQAMLRRGGEGLSDGQLLDCFLSAREEAAFEALLRRHGPMVLGVCRRILRHDQDAEDAFQATFLVLARKAASVSPRELVGPWLYGVACRTALKAKTAAARRRLRESPMNESSLPQPRPREDWSELAARLDDTIQRLPEQYRRPLVLCALEGKSRREAARQLCVPEGTLSSRLARARRMLTRRLTARGLALPAGALAAALSPQTVSAALPAALVSSTVQAAFAPANMIAAPVAALTQGVIQAMFLTKLKITAFVLVVLTATGLSAGLLGHRARAEKPAAKLLAIEAADKPKADVGPTIPAAVQSVDADKHTLTVQVQAEKGKKERVEKTFDLAKDVRVVLTHGLVKETKDGTLANLAEGVPVLLQLSPDEKTILRVDVLGDSLHGSVKAVGAGKNTITVVTKGKDGAVEKTLELAKGAKVLLDDGLVKGGAKEGKLGDLGADTPVVVQLSGYDRKTVVGIRAHGPIVHGSLKGVDAGTNMITITVKENATVEDRSFPLAKDVKANGGKVTDLTAGATVTLQLSVFDKKTVVAVHVPKSGE